MRRQTQEALSVQINQMIDSGTTAMADEVMFNPVSDYTDVGRLGSELAMLRRTPVVVGFASQCPNPKDFLAVDAAGMPVLVVRQADGGLRAFLNVCRHRGSKLTFEPCGHQGVFTCPYHAWSYRSDGSLLNLPNAEDFGAIDTSEFSLTSLAVEERHGFIWVLTTSGLPIDVAAFLGLELDDELAGYELERFQIDRSQTTTVATNWKVIVDGFLETYHLKTLHRTTIGPHIRNNLAPFRKFGPHGCMTAVRTSFDKVRHNDLAETNLRPYLVNAYQIFPNTVLVWSGMHMEAWLSFPSPADPGVTEVTVHVLGDRDQVESDPAYFDKNWEVVRSTVLTEDFVVGASIQQGFNSGAQANIVFGRNEPGVQHFHASLNRTLT